MSALLSAIAASRRRSSTNIKTSLVAWWSLNEASGNRSDSHGANTLSNIGTAIGGAAGRIGNASNHVFVSGSWLGAAFNGISSGDFTAGAWVNFNTVTSFAGLMSQDNNSGTNRHWAIRTNGSNQWGFYVLNSAVTLHQATATAAATAGVWQFVVARKMGAEIAIFIDSVKQALTGVFSGAAQTAASDLRLGAYGGGGMINARIDEAFVFSRALSDAEIATLYNGGAGLAYASL